jgi:hypothetical protein
MKNHCGKPTHFKPGNLGMIQSHPKQLLDWLGWGIVLLSVPTNFLVPFSGTLLVRFSGYKQKPIDPNYSIPNHW